MRTLLVVFIAISSLSAFAQTQPRTDTNRKVTEHIFEEGDTIDGDLSKPDVEYFHPGQRARFSGLIQVRQDFKDKVMESARDL